MVDAGIARTYGVVGEGTGVGVGNARFKVSVTVSPFSVQVVTAVPLVAPAGATNGSSPTPVGGMMKGPGLETTAVPPLKVTARVQLAPGTERMSMAEVARE